MDVAAIHIDAEPLAQCPCDFETSMLRASVGASDLEEVGEALPTRGPH